MRTKPIDDDTKDTKKGDQDEAKENESSDGEELEMPRSCSVPPAKWVEQSSFPDADDDDDELLNYAAKVGAWELTLKRDFNGEVQTYLENKSLRAEQKAKKKLKAEMAAKNMHERGPLADEKIILKICDLGNGCWTHHHFT